MSDIDFLVDRLEKLVQDSSRLPLTDKLMVEEEAILRIVDQLRTTIPAQIRDAQRLLQEREVSLVVVGMPRNMDGSLGAQAKSVLLFARRLQEQIEAPVLVWDERLSTVQASEILHAQGVRAREQKGRLDAVAAAVILQEYIDTERAERGDFGLLPPDPSS